MDEEVDFLTDLRESGSLFRFGRSLFRNHKQNCFEAKTNGLAQLMYLFLIHWRESGFLCIWHIQRKVTLLRDNYLRPWSDATRNSARCLIRAYDSFWSTASKENIYVAPYAEFIQKIPSSKCEYSWSRMTLFVPQNVTFSLMTSHIWGGRDKRGGVGWGHT